MRARNMLLPAAVSLLALAGATVALATSQTTGTVTACATVTAPIHTVAVDTTRVATVGGETATGCQTQTYTVPTVTVTAATATTTTTAVTQTTNATLGTSLPARMPESTGLRTWYVSPQGADTNDGTTTLTAFRTLPKALSVAASGDLVDLMGGSYSGPVVIQNRSYSASNPVTVQSYPGQSALFTGCATSCASNVLYFGNVNGVRLRNLTVTNSFGTGAGVKFDDSQNVEVDKTVIHDTYGVGILAGGELATGFPLAYSRNVQVWDSTLADTGLNGGTGTNQVHGIYLGSGAADGTKHGVDGFVVANNVFYDTPNGYALQLGDQAENGVVVSNTFDHAFGTTGGSGASIVVWGANGTYATQNAVIANNLFTDDVNHGILTNCSAPLSGISVRNNMGFANTGSDYLGSFGSTTCWVPGVNLPDADPQYLNRLGKDFRLYPTSPAVGKADPAYTPAFDHDGVARPAAPALGAFG